ncbi:hypothetical protein [Flavobacterium hydatis]|uniref:Uncharacterized protein n=1 Tax=Flavobacterium hydatis TaxID=991 RepID=A0A086AM46_FLAHY|nr:hypothetical protein [Flavobacterium hydatis]KFF17760.1 hypothetical protein IW20_07270 [Flavobacterium hydatis]OXA93703.1 hypothetical protein B0A62_13230 [Flavobacterium hydatis]
MKIINIVDSVKSVKVYDKKFYYCKSSKLYNNESQILINDIECQSFWQKNNIIFFHNNQGEYQLLNLENRIIHTLNCSPYLFTLDNDKVLASYDYSYNINSNSFDWKIGVFNIYNGEILQAIEKFDNCNFLLQDERIIIGFNKDKDISGFSNLDNRQLWNFSISSLKVFINDEGDELQTELISFIGINKKIVWILVTNRKIIGIDIEKGNLLHEIDLCKELGLVPDSIENFNFLVKDVHLDNENGIIKSLSYRYYWELNLDTFKIEIKKDFGENPKQSWRINRSAFYSEDKKLYFIGSNKGEVVNRAVGIFDTEKLEVIWYDAPLEEKKYLFFTDVPQANNKQLGVLDSENNLRIYQRE